MNSDRIHDALNYLDEDLIRPVEQLRNRGSRKTWTHWAAIAACFCLLATGVLTANKYGLLPIVPTLPDHVITPTNAPQAGTVSTGAGSAGGSHMEATQATAAPQTPPLGTAEVPSVLITVSGWEDNGFRGSVSGIVNTDIVPVGTAVLVQFAQNISVELPEGDVLISIPGPPDAADFPAGSTVHVRFCRSEANPDGSITLYAEAIGPA